MVWRPYAVEPEPAPKPPLLARLDELEVGARFLTPGGHEGILLEERDPAGRRLMRVPSLLNEWGTAIWPAHGSLWVLPLPRGRA